MKIIENEFNEEWIKSTDKPFIKKVKDHIDSSFGLSYVAFVSGTDKKPRWVIGIHGGQNGNGKWTSYLVDLLSTCNKLEKIFGNVTVLDVRNDVPDDVFDVRIIVSKEL